MFTDQDQMMESGRKSDRGYLASIMKTYETDKMNKMLNTISDGELDSEGRRSDDSGYKSNKKQTKLSELLGSKSPKQFANDFVYHGELSTVSDSKKKFSKAKAPNFRLDYKENVPRGCSSKTMTSPSSEKKISSMYRDDVVSPSKYTDLSNKILREFEIRNSVNGTQDRFSRSVKDNSKMLLTSVEVKRLEEKAKTTEIKNQQMQLSSRLHREAEALGFKNKELASRIEEETLKECTFTPAINKGEGDNDEEYMTADQFFEMQMQKARELEEKRQRLFQEKQEMENSGSYQPEIGKKTRELAKKNFEKLGIDNADVHSRLHIMKSYKDKRPKGLQSQTEPKESEIAGLAENCMTQTREDLFSPKINKKSQNIKRGEKVENILYSDAKRRNEKKKELEKEKEQSDNIKITSPRVSSKSRQVYVRGFCKEFEEILETVQAGKITQSLSYLEMVEVLRKLEFLPALENGSSVGENPKESTLLQKVWYVLKGLQNDFVLARNLLVLLLAVMNIHSGEEIPLVKEKIVKPAGSPMREVGSSWSQYFQDENLVNLGKFDANGNMFISQLDIERVRVSLNSLSINRISKKRKFDQDLNPSWFSPQISEVSKMLGSNKKDRIVAEMKENLLKNFSVSGDDSKEEVTKERFTIDEILKFKKDKSKNEQWELKNRLEERLMEECTFKPKISENPFSAKKVLKEQNDSCSEGTLTRLGALSSGKKTHRTIELFQMSKHSTKKMDKDPKELEYEKQCDQCTFMPDVSTAHFIPTSPKGADAKGVNTVIQRMKDGRMEKNLNDFIKHKGISGSASRKDQTAAVLEDKEKKEFNKLRKQKSQKVKPKLDTNLQGNIKSKTSSFTLKMSGLRRDDSSIGKTFENIEIKMEEENFAANNNKQKTDDDRTPLLFIDVNIEEGKNARIIIYEGDRSDEIARKFGLLYNLDETTIKKLKEMLDQQISGILTKIDEETVSNDDSGVNTSYTGD